MEDKIDLVVCYHKKSPIFQSNALKPLHLGKALSEMDLGLRGDDTGDNISVKNKWYAEETAFYWLWKNSKANIKGIMHAHRLLDLRSSNGSNTTLALEDIELTDKVIDDFGWNVETISKIMQDVDVIIRKKQDLNDWFDGNIEEHYKACHIPEYLDYAMDIIKNDFPHVVPAAKNILSGHFGHFNNLVIMKTEFFNDLCEFKFGVLGKLEETVDVTRPEIVDGWRHTARYAAFIGELMTMFFIEYLRNKGQMILEFPVVNISPKGTSFSDDVNCNMDAYAGEKTQEVIEPFFGEDAIAVMMASDDKYAPYASVMLQSIIDNASSKKNYDIVIVGNSILDNNKRLLRSMARPNVSVRVVDISGMISSLDCRIFTTRAYFTIETYYRFFIPKLFQQYHKVLYLDCDMVALHDIADLYETDIGENWWGVIRDLGAPIRAFSGENAANYKNYVRNMLKMDSLFDYFSAGVMLWNVKACRNDSVLDKLLARLKEIGTPRYVDQDVMNSLANGKHVHWLSLSWNVGWWFCFYFQSAKKTIAYKTALHLLENPLILHYGSPIKPWAEPNRPHAHIFWVYARKTPFYEIILHEFIQANLTSSMESINKKGKRNDAWISFNQKQFFSMTNFIDIWQSWRGKPVVFYGAGIYMRKILKQLQRYHLSFEFQIWDIKAAEMGEIEGYKIVKPDFDTHVPSGHVAVITIQTDEVIFQVRDQLTELGFFVFTSFEKFILGRE